ncbi:MAG: DUF4397 domain-containing protein [Cyanobacteria bacterium J06648_11]
MQCRYRRAIAIASASLAAFAIGCSENSSTVDPVEQTSVRAVQAVPDAPEVDVFVNGDEAFADVAFFAVTDFVVVPEGDIEVEVFESDPPSQDPVVSETIQNTLPDTSQTVTVAGLVNPEGNQQALQVDVFENDLETTVGQAELRIIHLSPDAPEVDIRLGDNDPDGDLLATLSFGEATAQNIEVAPGTYTVTVFAAGTETNVFTQILPAVVAEENYTIYAVGLIDDDAPQGSEFSLEVSQDT